MNTDKHTLTGEEAVKLVKKWVEKEVASASHDELSRLGKYLFTVSISTLGLFGSLYTFIKINLSNSTISSCFGIFTLVLFFLAFFSAIYFSVLMILPHTRNIENIDIYRSPMELRSL